MQATQLLHNYLGKRCQAIHKTRLQAIVIGVRALMHGKTLSVTGIGRAIASRAYTKHAIYRAMIPWLPGKIHQPAILI